MASRNLLPKDLAVAVAEEGGKPFKTNALTVTGLPGPQHPPKVDGLGENETKESVSMNTGLSRPAHPPKVSGEPFINTFTCDALTSSGNELYEPPSNQGKAYTDTDSDGKTEIITDITCKFKDKLVAMEVKVDPGSEDKLYTIESFQAPVPLSYAERMAIPRRTPWNQLWLSLKHMMVAS